MHDVFDPLRSYLAIEPISIDNKIFQLHYKVTVIILIACSLMLTQKQYFGDPIDCQLSAGSSIDLDLIDTFCWIQSTYTMPYSPKSENSAHAGIRPSGEGDEIKHHNYYQWVTLFLVLQAVVFYVPRYMWMIWEGGKLEMLVKDLQLPLIESETKEKRIKVLISYFQENMHNHVFYTWKFIFCEVLNFVNVLCQIYFTDRFVGFEFASYGLDVLSQTEKEFEFRIDPMDKVFPKMAKCDFRNYGPSGTYEHHDALCVLPLNVFNEKVYLILWFWFVIIGVASGLGLIYRIATFSKSMRRILLQSKTTIGRNEDVNKINDVCEYGDWFLLYQIAKNMEPFTLREFLKQLASTL